MPETGEHKKAWQTAQRALQIARDVEAKAQIAAPKPEHT